MISKLVRFEARSTFRLLVIVWAALLAMAIIIGGLALITHGGFYQDLLQGSKAVYVIDKIVSTLMWILYGALFVAQIVLTLAIVVLRFYRGMLGDEGYLMHTLPVKTGDLITSKGIVATVAIIGSIIIGTLSILIMVFSIEPDGLRYVMYGFKTALQEEPLIPLYIVEGLIVLVISILSAVYQIYASMSVGQLLNRYRVLMSLAVYIGIGMVLSTVGTVLGVLAGSTDLGIWLGDLMNKRVLGPQMIFLGMFLTSAIPLVAFHIMTEKLLSRRLNLL
jgi:hypothetical protein